MIFRDLIIARSLSSHDTTNHRDILRGVVTFRAPMSLNQGKPNISLSFISTESYVDVVQDFTRVASVPVQPNEMKGFSARPSCGPIFRSRI